MSSRLFFLLFVFTGGLTIGGAQAVEHQEKLRTLALVAQATPLKPELLYIVGQYLPFVCRWKSVGAKNIAFTVPLSTAKLMLLQRDGKYSIYDINKRKVTETGSISLDQDNGFEISAAAPSHDPSRVLLGLAKKLRGLTQEGDKLLVSFNVDTKTQEAIDEGHLPSGVCSIAAFKSGLVAVSEQGRHLSNMIHLLNLQNKIDGAVRSDLWGSNQLVPLKTANDSQELLAIFNGTGLQIFSLNPKNGEHESILYKEELVDDLSKKYYMVCPSNETLMFASRENGNFEFQINTAQDELVSIERCQPKKNKKHKKHAARGTKKACWWSISTGPDSKCRISFSDGDCTLHCGGIVASETMLISAIRFQKTLWHPSGSGHGDDYETFLHIQETAFPTLPDIKQHLKAKSFPWDRWPLLDPHAVLSTLGKSNRQPRLEQQAVEEKDDSEDEDLKMALKRSLHDC